MALKSIAKRVNTTVPEKAERGMSNAPEDFLTLPQMQALHYRQAEGNIDMNKKMLMESFSYSLRNQFEAETLKRKFQILERKEDLKLRRELLSYQVAEDADGYLQVQLVDDTGKVLRCKRLFSVNHMLFTKFYAERDETQVSIYGLRWDGMAKKRAFFSEESLTPQNFLRVLRESGITPQVAREYKRNLIDGVLAFLIKHCRKVKIPLTTGWNYIYGRWKYIEINEMSMKGLENHVL